MDHEVSEVSLINTTENIKESDEVLSKNMKSKYGLRASKQQSLDKLKLRQKEHKTAINSRKQS